MARIMIQGTGSSVGKSIIVAALCRIFKQDGYSVCPYKSQNMSLNSYITMDGKEMGRGQVLQAYAAGIEPQVFMNPILLKPTGDIRCQVIVNGKVYDNHSAEEYHNLKILFKDMLKEQFLELEKAFDIIVMEGAGSPAEINLRDRDIVNMGMAELVDAPVLIVGDIDKGGVFASLAGTMLLLTDEERIRVKGTIINKFRGDIKLLNPGIDMLEEIIRRTCLGVVPYFRLVLEDEDGAMMEINKKVIAPIDVAVIMLPHPVIFIGKLIKKIENKARTIAKSDKQLKFFGGVMVIIVAITSFLVPLILLFLTWQVKPLFHIVNIIILWTTITAKCLKDESMKVYFALEDKDISMARKFTSYIVGRDTKELDEKQLVRATVETVAAEIIKLTISTLKKLCIVVPSFSEYESVAKNYCEEIIFSPLNEDFGYNYRDILDKLKECDGLVIANPNNPNGGIINRVVFEEILDYCEENKKRIIIDESFVEFVNDKNQSIIDKCKDFKCLFIIRALTKFFGMPGVRFGYGVSSDAEFINSLSRHQIPWNINTFAEIAVKSVLKDEEYINNSKAMLQKERIYFAQKLNKFKFIENVYESHANFLLIRLGKMTGEEIFNYCISKGVLIRRCRNYRGLDDYFIRLAIKGFEDNNILLSIFEDFEGELQHKVLNRL